VTVQAALHGFGGVPYLTAAVIVGAVTVALLFVLAKRAGTSARAVG